MVEEITVLQEKLTAPDEETRRQAVVAAARHPFDQVREIVFLALGDTSWRVRKEALDVLLATSPRESDIERVIDLLRSHDNAGLRNSAVECLERLGSEAALVLRRYVADPDHDVRKFIIDIMGSIADPSFVPLLLSAMDDADPNVSAAAVENLGKIGDPQAVPVLLEALERKDVLLRYAIVEALGKIGRPVPLEVIAKLAEENLMKKAVFECLGAIGGLDSLPLLIEGLKDRARNAREAAAVALVTLREKLTAEERTRTDALLQGLKGSPFCDGILRSFEVAEGQTKEALLKIIALIGDERGAVCLLRACRDDRFRSLCVQAFRSMGDAGLQVLVDLYETASNEERCLIAYVCSETGYRGAEAILASGLSSAYPPLRRISAEAAGRIGLSHLTAEIAVLLDDSEKLVVDGAVIALQRLSALDKETVMQVIVPRAGSASPEARRQAAVLFASLGDGERLSLLVKDEDASVRKDAVISLASLRIPSSVGNLVMTLVDEDPDVRLAAVEALGDIGGNEVFEPLQLALRDEDPWVVCAALKSLSTVGGERAADLILAQAECADGMVMITALEALGTIGGEKALAAVYNALQNNDEEIVKAAIDILAHKDRKWVEECKDTLLAHPNWDVRSSYIRATATILGNQSRPILEEALVREQDEMVRQQIKDLLGSMQ